MLVSKEQLKAKRLAFMIIMYRLYQGQWQLQQDESGKEVESWNVEKAITTSLVGGLQMSSWRRYNLRFPSRHIFCLILLRNLKSSY